ncbi:MAG: hypothetical protein IT377_01675 [Polyangiaceae bacterium]|nr:hypothetical protein [Myxococcales bacterium]MCC6897649.1 hypothetical protein [Polyangiaceae bacterium]
MRDSFVRCLLILRQVPEAPGRVDTKALAAFLEQRGIVVTRRTLQRDLEAMSRVLPLVCDDRTKPYGWSWRADVEVPLPEPIRRSARVA